MTKEISDSIIPDESILSKIYFIRGNKVMLDRDLAFLYGVETKNLQRQVRRNELRFPADFMFELNADEFEDWRRQFGTSNEDRMGLRYKPFAFTEEGVAQLSTPVTSSTVTLPISSLFFFRQPIIFWWRRPGFLVFLKFFINSPNDIP